jgi:hypothetical protein
MLRAVIAASTAPALVAIALPGVAAPVRAATTPTPLLRRPVNASVCATPNRTLTGSAAQTLNRAMWQPSQPARPFPAA